MRLAELQRALRDVLRGADLAPTSEDPDLCVYLAEVNNSGRLQVLAQIRRSWRVYDLERACPLTAAALQTRGYWESTLANFNSEPGSPFVELLAEHFLDLASQHGDPVVASVAPFERAYRAVLRGSRERFVVKWDRDPAAVLSRLAIKMPLDDLNVDNEYLTIVGFDLPNLFEISVELPD